VISGRISSLAYYPGHTQTGSDSAQIQGSRVQPLGTCSSALLRLGNNEERWINSKCLSEFFKNIEVEAAICFTLDSNDCLSADTRPIRELLLCPPFRLPKFCDA
jgi:hypothetical protein